MMSGTRRQRHVCTAAPGSVDADRRQASASGNKTLAPIVEERLLDVSDELMMRKSDDDDGDDDGGVFRTLKSRKNETR